MSYLASLPKCKDPRRCFAKTGQGLCKCLSSAYPAGKRCPFWKLPDDADISPLAALTIRERDAEIYRLLTEERASTTEIADIYGISESHVRTIASNQRRQHGVPPQPKANLTEEMLKRARELLKQGLGPTEIADRIGRSPTTVVRWKRRGLI